MGDEKQLSQVSFAEFDATTYETWKKEAIVSLKGGAFEKKLFTNTYEGIQLEPIYTAEHVKNLEHPHSLPGFADYVRSTKASGYLSAPWTVAQACEASLPERFNQQLKMELEKGTTGIHILLDDATKHGLDADTAALGQLGKGLSLSTLGDIDQALGGIAMEKYPLHIMAGASNVGLLGMLCAVQSAQGKTYEELHGCVGADPLGVWVKEGCLPCSLDELYDEMAHTTAWVAENMPDMRSILVEGQVYHDGGASAVQELGYAMSTAADYIRALQLRGLSINTVARHVRFSFSLGANFFMELAKIRAARIVWAQIVSAFGGDEEAQKINIHARTSYFTKTVYDPYVNMLRTTTEAFSGVVGGVDSLQVGLFDEAIRLGDDFSRRIARNTQRLLQEECNLQQPIDPAGGSWYVETLTNQIAEKTWNLLQQIEQAGGMRKALEQELPQQAVAEVLGQRMKKLAVRADRSVGTNMYANMLETPLEAAPLDVAEIRGKRTKETQEYRADVDAVYCKSKLAPLLDTVGKEPGKLLTAVIEAFGSGATLGQVYGVLHAENTLEQPIRPIPVHRVTEEFENLRNRTLAYKEKTGDNLKVFLANMGPIPQHKARADFSRGFMEVGGFEVLKNDGFPSVEEAVEAALSSKADVAIICSTDDTYPELVPPLAEGIKKGNPKMTVLLAGAPQPELEETYREAGVDDFIHVRANCYKILCALQTAKGMA